MAGFVRSAGQVLVRIVVALSFCLLLVVTLGPRTGRFQVLTVLSGSMTPVAPKGSLAVIEPKSRHDLRVGDVLTYSIPVEDHHVVTHRVIELHRTANGTIVKTKGDANDAADPWLANLSEPTVWTERFAVPYVGHLIGALRSPFVHRLGQLAPLLLAATFLRHLWRREGSEADALVV